MRIYVGLIIATIKSFVNNFLFFIYQLGEKETHMEVVRMVMDFALSIGFGVLGLAFSPIKGPEGNIEYLILVQKSDQPVNNLKTTAKDVVMRSHDALDHAPEAQNENTDSI